jgi:hypothetical protein
VTTPFTPVPDEIDRWIARLPWLRRADAAVAWLGIGSVLLALPGAVSPARAAVLALAIVVAGLAVRPLRALWRPVSAYVGLAVSRDLRPGDRAWYVRARRADPVLVTARRGTRLGITTPGLEIDQVLTVRRTRVLLLPWPGPAARPA